MAVYKPEDITAQLIREEFPQVAAELQTQPEITLESLRQTQPDIVAAIAEEARAEAIQEKDAVATAERERVMAIMGESVPGAEAIISAAIADPSMGVDDVKMALYDFQKSNRSASFEQHKKDGESLAGDLREISGGTGDDGEKPEAKKIHEKIMAKLEKGEK